MSTCDEKLKYDRVKSSCAIWSWLIAIGISIHGRTDGGLNEIPPFVARILQELPMKSVRLPLSPRSICMEDRPCGAWSHYEIQIIMHLMATDMRCSPGRHPESFRVFWERSHHWKVHIYLRPFRTAEINGSRMRILHRFLRALPRRALDTNGSALSPDPSP